MNIAQLFNRVLHNQTPRTGAAMKDVAEMRTHNSSLHMNSTVESLKSFGKVMKNGFRLEKNKSKPKKKVSWAEPLTIVRCFSVETASRDVMSNATEDANEWRQIDLHQNTYGKMMHFESNTNSLEQCTKREIENISQLPKLESITKELVHMSLHSTCGCVDEMNKLFAMCQEMYRPSLDGLVEEWV